MNVVEGAADRIRTALRTVPGVRHFAPALGQVDPPATALGPPRLEWQSYSSDPTSATFSVAVIVASDNRFTERLLALYEPVVAALELVEGAVVRSANPGTYPSGAAELPAYLIEVDVAL